MKEPFEDGQGGSSRRTFVLSAAALCVGALVTEGVLLAPRRLRVSHHTLGNPDHPSKRIRLAVLTDLHLGRLRGFHEELATAVEEARPDILLLVGDSVDDPGALPVLGEFLDLLPLAPLRFATLGNWEYWGGVDLQELRRTYEAGDTALLVNEGIRLSSGAALYAVDDPLAGRPDLGALPPPSERPDTLLLSHCPVYRDRLTGDAARRITAVISGHTHGGQVALAGWAPLLPPGSGGYASGWYRGGNAPDLFVSRGLGTSVVPVRIGALPELAIVDWYPER
jgi:predicted MPP superfamily phosphohydrolase